ncbi:MAG: FecR domain-containing protein, partial [Armatimonadetes bacterium]|nr:FecR domain-containing protein [Armatimonadota bacterium]
MLWRKRRPKPLTEEQLLAQTVEEIRERQERQQRMIRRFYRRVLPEWLDRRIVFGLLAVLAALIADGVRRENTEFVARLTELSGTVYVQSAYKTAPATGTVGALLQDGDQVITGANSYATLEFPDGSVITVGPSTQFEVRRLEYSRGGRWKSRTFRLAAGRVWVKVSEYFGAGSDMRVYTRAAVAAVRGTRFSVAYDPSADSTSVVCEDGTVTFAGWRGSPVQVIPRTAASCQYGSAAGYPAAAAPEEFTGFGIAALRRPDVQDSWLKKAELWITYFLDLPLSVLGIGRCSWGVGAADYARRTAAMEALRRIHVHLESFTSYPDFVNPATLEELGIPEVYARRILSAFYGGAIERYYRTSRG